LGSDGSERPSHETPMTAMAMDRQTNRRFMRLSFADAGRLDDADHIPHEGAR
jgi:hypothetical protein